MNVKGFVEKSGKRRAHGAEENQNFAGQAG
jgi:hypothetical protein